MTMFMLLVAAYGYCQDWIYTVRPGDNLWNLTETYLTDMRYWRPLQALNQVADPEHIPPGTRLRMPIAWLRVQPAAARIVTVQGEVTIRREATGEQVAATPVEVLQTGDRIHTGPDGVVLLAFGDGSQLLLQAGSELVMDTLSTYGGTGMVDTRLRLQRGRVDSDVTPRQGTSVPRFEVETPAAITAVRGTRYRVAADASLPVARTEVLGGQVTVRAAGRSRTVPANFGTLTRAGAAPEPPVPLLPPPVVAQMPAVVDRVPIPVDFPPLPGATGYRLQIAPDDGFQTLLFDRTLRAPPAKGPDLPDGDYVLRLRGIDARGLEGRDAVQRFRLDARPEPPALIMPQNNALVYEQQLQFQWSEPEDADTYRFQLATSTNFAAPLVDYRGRGGRFGPAQSLPAGSYYWRVATRDRTGAEGPFSDPQRFRLQPAPAVEEPVVDERQMTFRWRAGAPDQRYQFQLAPSADFAAPVVDVVVAEPQVTIARPEAGLYALRIRPIESDGAPGPFGPPQRIAVPPESYWPYGLFAAGLLLLLLP
jgi:hypothetical protein